MTLIMLLIVVLVGCAVIYWLPESKKVVLFVFAVCAILWLLTILGVLPSNIRIR